MAVARPVLGMAAIVLLAGGILLQFFIVLSGAIYSTPESSVYFLQASTGGIPTNNGVAVNNPTRWTYFALCGVDGDYNANCSPAAAAIPFQPTQNFNTNQGVPDEFVNNQNKYYYLSRFSWVFYIMALFFAVIAFLICLLALCSRLGAYLTASTTSLAVFFQALAGALMTAWVVQGKNAFVAAGFDAQIGRYAMGFTWATFACWFAAMVLFCIGGTVGGESTTRSGKGGLFSRKRSTRSRGSFIDTESRRGVKDEYD